MMSVRCILTAATNNFVYAGNVQRRSFVLLQLMQQFMISSHNFCFDFAVIFRCQFFTSDNHFIQHTLSSSLIGVTSHCMIPWSRNCLIKYGACFAAGPCIISSTFSEVSPNDKVAG